MRAIERVGILSAAFCKRKEKTFMENHPVSTPDPGGVPARMSRRAVAEQRRAHRIAIARRARSARDGRRVFEIAAAANLSPQAIYKVEGAGGDITVSTATALADALGVDLGWLLRGNRLCPACDEAVGPQLTPEISIQPRVAVGG